MDHPPFPLPIGHTYGPNAAWDISRHDGRNPLEGTALYEWQRTYTGRWKRPSGPHSGVYDGPTQRAVVEVQKALGVPVTGLLGPDEWAAVWTTLPPDPTEARIEQVALKIETDREKELERKRTWRRDMDKYSKWKTTLYTDPNAPAWFPGRPMMHGETGDHVRRVQEILGMKPTGNFSGQMVRQVRGFQKANGLPVSGIIDSRCAIMLDPPNDEDPPA